MYTALHFIFPPRKYSRYELDVSPISVSPLLNNQAATFCQVTSETGERAKTPVQTVFVDSYPWEFPFGLRFCTLLKCKYSTEEMAF